MRNTASPRRTWPSGSSASQPSAPRNPAGWVSAAIENPPLAPSTRAIDAASNARSATAGGGPPYFAAYPCSSPARAAGSGAAYQAPGIWPDPLDGDAHSAGPRICTCERSTS